MTILTVDPLKIAHDLHLQLGWTNPLDFTLEEIANSLGVCVREIPIQGSEGRILINKNTGIISINSSITHLGKKNFVLAHEIGHFLMHKEIEYLFTDNYKTLSDWHTNGIHERQANAFATELLMPKNLFQSIIGGKKLNIAFINDISSYFRVSMMAAFLRYIQLGIYPAMLIYMEKGIVKWKQYSNDFPFKYLQVNTKVPAYTVAGDYFYHGRIETQPEKIEAIEWFPEDRQLKHQRDTNLWEQCYQISTNGLVSCLWTD